MVLMLPTDVLHLKHGGLDWPRRRTHRLRQTQSVLDRLGLTTADEKLSNVSGPLVAGRRQRAEQRGKVYRPGAQVPPVALANVDVPVSAGLHRFMSLCKDPYMCAHAERAHCEVETTFHGMPCIKTASGIHHGLVGKWTCTFATCAEPALRDSTLAYLRTHNLPDLKKTWMSRGLLAIDM